MRWMRIVVVLLLGSYVCAQGAPTAEEWGATHNSAGATLTFRETSREKMQGKTVVSGNLYANGLPASADYTLWMWQGGKPPQAVADAYINTEGKIVNRLADPTNNVSEDPIDLRFLGGKGEAKRLAIISNDGQYRAFIDVVPFPLESTDHNCRVTATTFDPGYFAVTIRGTGFVPNEKLVVNTESGNERAETNSVASSKGTYTAVVGPFVKGKRSGKERFVITGSACKVRIEFPWGEGAYQLQ